MGTIHHKAKREIKQAVSILGEPLKVECRSDSYKMQKLNK